ncbi:MAG TPA: BMP family ABC transporter substrate-binding protein [Caldilineaceae bacterium]|nr:BMP family ABC transporter substrate-binding protein [Caldilineaceae bacterium]
MQKQNRLFLLLSLLLATLLFAACVAPMPAGDTSGGETASSDSGNGTMAANVKVGLVTDVGRVNDRSFNQSAWEGVLQACEMLGLAEGDDCKYIETQDPADYADNIQQFIDGGFNMIVSVGFALGEATAAAAQENPDIMFIGVDQFQVDELPNLTGLIFHEDQSGFLAGALAAQLSQTGKVASVLGTDLVPPVVAFGQGFELGAKYINPDIEVSTTYHPGGLDKAFIDPEWGASTARQALDQGADVIFGAGGSTGNGALQEVASAEGAGDSLFCIGVDTDQWETLPAAHACLVSSAMKLITPGVVELVGMANEGTFPGGNYYGGAGLAPFHDFEESIPQEVKDKLAEIDAGLKDGSLETGYNPGG